MDTHHQDHTEEAEDQVGDWDLEITEDVVVASHEMLGAVGVRMIAEDVVVTRHRSLGTVGVKGIAVDVVVDCHEMGAEGAVTHH